MSRIDQHFQYMAKGPLGAFADGPAGRLWGFLDRATEETARLFDQGGRHQTRLDDKIVFKVGALYSDTIVREDRFTFPDQKNHRGTKTYRVLDIGNHGDVVTRLLYLGLVVSA